MKLAVEPLYLLHDLHHFLRMGEGIASVDIDGQLSLFVHITQVLIDPLMKLLALRPACVKDCAHAGFDGEINPALKRRVDLLVRHGG